LAGATIALHKSLIFFNRTTTDAALASDLLAYDPDGNGWFNEVRDRTVVAAAMENIALPFALVSWKSIASDRLSCAEQVRLKTELERIAGAMVFHHQMY